MNLFVLEVCNNNWGKKRQKQFEFEFITDVDKVYKNAMETNCISYKLQNVA